MIEVTRLNGETYFLNAAHIESVEAGVDTRIELANGKQIYVQEEMEEIRDRMSDWFRSFHVQAPRLREKSSED